jgi:cytochrome c-type biogenesis protein CcmI
VSNSQILAIIVLALPALAFILWPLWRKHQAPAGTFLLPSPQDRRDELTEEKRALYRALSELTFDHQAGHLSEDDYTALRNRYEARAAQLLKELDALEARHPKAEPRVPVVTAPARPPRAWTRHPVTLTLGAVILVGFGLTLGLGVARYTEPDRTMIPPGSRLPVPIEAPGMQGMGGMGQSTGAGGREPRSPPMGVGREPGGPPLGDPSRPISSETFRGMLDAAHQALDAGQFQQAIAAYQAVLKRDPKNVEAITHLGVILSVANHTDQALEAFDRALAIDPTYAHAWWDKARVLYEAKQDYQGAIRAWEKFVSLVPSGEERDRVNRMIMEAKARLAGGAKK